MTDNSADQPFNNESTKEQRVLSPLTLRGKALLFLIPTIVAISLVYTLEAIYTENNILKDELIKKGETIALVAAKNAELPILSESSDLIARSAVSLKGIRDVAFVAFCNKKFTVLIHEGVPAASDPPVGISLDTPTVFERSGFFEFYAPVFTTRVNEDIDIFQETLPKNPLKEHIGWVHIGLSKDIMNKTSHDVIVRCIVLALIFTIGGVVLVFVVLTIALKPLHSLFMAVKGVRHGEYTEIAEIPSQDEIGKLSSEFNRMSLAIKEREIKILASEKRIKTLFERVEHAIFRLDKVGIILEANDKFIAICGGTDKFCTLFPGKQEGQRLHKAKLGELRNAEEKIIGSDGNEHTVIMSLYPEFDEHHEVAGFDGYFFDITEKKRLEETLIQTQKLESVGLLAGGIAHDFNNILTGILGYATLIKRMVRQDDKMYHYTDIIEKSAIRATSLTNQLLGFARKGKYQIARLSINSIVKELVTFLRETFDRNITIVLDMADDLPPAEGDGNQIYQALLNLCINARDAMPEGGKLHLKTEFLVLADDKVTDSFQISAGEYVVISVTDTGTGIPPEIKKRIFEPFYTTKDVGKGTGLGLSMVYGIIKNHGGYITVDSEPGLSTAMRIYLPKTDERAPEKGEVAL